MAMLSLALILPIVLAIARHLIKQRSSSVNRPRSSLITDCFYYAALATQTTLCSMLIYRTSTEIKLRNVLRHKSPSGESPETIIFHKMTEPRMLLILWLSGCCYYSVVCLVKGAFLAFYWGLYDNAGISFKWIRVTIVLTIVSALLALAFGIGWCRPIYRNWSNDYDDYVKCTSVNSLAVRCVGTITNVITDTAIVLLPISLLSRLTLGLREKAALGFVYSMGFVSVIACLSSLVNLVKHFFKNPLSLDNVRFLEMWSVIEATTALFAFSLPAFKKFILRTIGTRPRDKVRPMRRVEDQQQIEGAEDLENSGGTDSTSNPKPIQLHRATSGDGNTDLKKARGARSMVSGWFDGGKKGSSKSSGNGKDSLPSFVRGSLVGGTGWTIPNVESGGIGENSRNRRRTLDDTELSSFDDYEEDREAVDEQIDKESKTMRGAIQGANIDILVAEGSKNRGTGGAVWDERGNRGEGAIWDESLSPRGTYGIRGLL
ncbi:hypothetical protein EV426DRAFT_573564 [Tirmania nivea]|nr:hypothetical protein EV426DRAFT_573564 [Tirmania nivea]